jgi:hypothetical protein
VALKSNIKYKFWQQDIKLKQDRIKEIEKVLLDLPEQYSANEIFALKRDLKALRQSVKSLLKNVEYM